MAHAEQSPTTTKALDRDLPQALGAAIAATVLAGLLIGSLALFTSAAPAGEAEAAAVTDGWMAYLGAATVEPDVVDGWSSYLTPAAPIVTDGWASYLGAAAEPDVTDGWMSLYGNRGD